jgi:hypothetical protein
MQDSDLEALLNKYRPADPPPSLARLVESPNLPVPQPSNPRTWPWAIAAAALLAITVGLQAGRRPAAFDLEPGVRAAAETLTEASAGERTSLAIAEWTLATSVRLAQQRELQAIR